MRLYATITSERAKKSQGGNREIVVEFYVGSKAESIKIAEVILTPHGTEEYKLVMRTLTERVDFLVRNKDIRRTRFVSEKAKSKKPTAP